MKHVGRISQVTEFGGGQRKLAFGWELGFGEQHPKVLPFASEEQRHAFVAGVTRLLPEGYSKPEHLAALEALRQWGSEDQALAAQRELESALGVPEAETFSLSAEPLLDGVLARPAITPTGVEPTAGGATALRLTLDVEYETNGTGLDTLRANLEGMIVRALGDGGLTEDTPAEVSGWNVSVAALEPTTSMASLAPSPREGRGR